MAPPSVLALVLLLGVLGPQPGAAETSSAAASDSLLAEVTWFVETLQELQGPARGGLGDVRRTALMEEVQVRLAVASMRFGPAALRAATDWPQVEEGARGVWDDPLEPTSRVAMLRAQLLGDRSRSGVLLEELGDRLEGRRWTCGNALQWARDEYGLLRAAWWLEGGRPGEALAVLTELSDNRRLSPTGERHRQLRGLRAFALRAVGREVDAQPDLQHLVDLHPDHPWGRDARAILLRDGVLIEPTLERVASLAGDSKRSADRAAAVHAMGAHGFPGAYEWLATTADEFTHPAHPAAMGMLDDPRATEWLERTTRHSNRSIAWEALRALGRRPDPSTDALLDAMLTRLAEEGDTIRADRQLVIDALRAASGGGPDIPWDAEQLRGPELARRWREWLARGDATAATPGAEG